MENKTTLTISYDQATDTLTVTRTTEKETKNFFLELVDGQLLPKSIATDSIPYNVIKVALKHTLGETFSNKEFDTFINDMKAFERGVALTVFTDKTLDVSCKGRTLKDGRKSSTGRATEKKMKQADFKRAFEMLPEKKQAELRKTILGI